MKKGQTKRVLTPEQKAEIVHKHLDEHISVRTLEKQYNADRSMICHWVKKYIEEGESSFNHKGHPGNKFAALLVLLEKFVDKVCAVLEIVQEGFVFVGDAEAAAEIEDGVIIV